MKVAARLQVQGLGLTSGNIARGSGENDVYEE